MHQLSIEYFEGKISGKDEAVLYDFLAENQENKAFFINWESQWRVTHRLLLETVESWEGFEYKLYSKQKDHQINSEKRGAAFIRRIGSIAAAVAAVFALIFGLVFLNKYLTQRDLVRSCIGQTDSFAFVFETHNAEQSRVKLPDGTVVWLNAATTLKCPANFNITHRTLDLAGEAYFEVNKNTELPFVVHVKECPITVTGTKFNVTAYEDESVITTALLEGALLFGYETRSQQLVPNEVIRYDMAKKTLNRTNVNAKQFISWTEGRIEYDCITFNELFSRLSRQYDVNILINSDRKLDKVFNISLNNSETVNDVLNALSLIIPMTIERTGRNLTITFK
ncbi:MAG: FecR domain-containing protein [Bacteroidales bacterium]|nr:FecR domain-containing protein [Bacteroidales bacterium]